MNLAFISAVAVDAQAAVHHLNDAARLVGLPPEGETVRRVYRARLVACSQCFAGTRAANDVDFHTKPETA